MYYYATNGSHERTLTKDEVASEVSLEFKKLYGFEPTEEIIKEIIKHKTSYMPLPENVNEAHAYLTMNKGEGLAQVMLGFMQSTTDTWFDDNVSEDEKQKLCNETTWTITFASGEKHIHFNLGWGPAELEEMESLVKNIIMRADEIGTV